MRVYSLEQVEEVGPVLWILLKVLVQTYKQMMKNLNLQTKLYHNATHEITYQQSNLNLASHCYRFLVFERHLMGPSCILEWKQRLRSE